MRFFIPKLNTPAKIFLRECGYSEFIDPRSEQHSYIRLLHAGRFYPRFHIYLEQKESQSMLNLHLDAKQPRYEGTAAHSGEYEGPIIQQEATRIQGIAKNFTLNNQPSSQPLGFAGKKSLLKKILGFLKER